MTQFISQRIFGVLIHNKLRQLLLLYVDPGFNVFDPPLHVSQFLVQFGQPVPEAPLELGEELRHLTDCSRDHFDVLSKNKIKLDC